MTLASRDNATIWHPYTQHQIVTDLIPIVRGENAYLIDQTGNRYLDLISSWWVNVHGHGHPVIAEAIYQQALKLEHVIFSNFTHEPAVVLAEKLLNVLPAHFKKVFYSDNGSTAVEVALKMAYQFWKNQGQVQRRRFLAFHNGYHGDTFGAMAVGQQSGYFTSFNDLLFSVDMADYPTTWMMDEDISAKEQNVLAKIAKHLQQWGNETAALIIEPLIQGASGMNICRPEFLRQLETLIKEYGILVIYDEVMTGFGRTGDFFACNKAQTTPDIICLAKGLTGGFLPLAVTACSEAIYQAFLGSDFSRALAHGHSFAGNPLGCAASIASLELLQQPTTQEKIKQIANIHQEELVKILAVVPQIEKVRYCGTVAAFDLKLNAKYGSSVSVKLRERFLKRGLLIRPLGNVAYLLPPYCISEADLRLAYQIIREEVQELII